MSSIEVIEAAYASNEDNLKVIFAMIDADDETLIDHERVNVVWDGDEIDSIEYDNESYEWRRIEADGRQLLDAYAMEIDSWRGAPLKILLETGGPSTWIEATLDSDGDVRSAVFISASGSDERRTHLSKHCSLYRYAESIAESEKCDD